MQNVTYIFVFTNAFPLYVLMPGYSGITSGRVLDGELLYTEILEVKLERNLHETVCRQMQIN